MIGFVLGVIFGAVFKTDQHSIDIVSGSENVQIKEWSEVSYIKKDSVLKSFNINSQVGVIKYFEELKKKDQQMKDIKLKVKYSDGKEGAYETLKEISKPIN